MKRMMMKSLAFMFGILLAAQVCIVPSFAIEKEVANIAQVENSEEASPYAEYISYYSATPPAGATRSDYKALAENRTGNVSLDQYAANKTMETLIKIVAPTFGAKYQDLANKGLEHLFSGLEVAVKKFAPEGGNMKYQRLGYINEKISEPMNKYYMHIVTYTLPGGVKKQVTMYETRTWI